MTYLFVSDDEDKRTICRREFSCTRETPENPHKCIHGRDENVTVCMSRQF